MQRLITLCTSQWTDLPLEVLAKKARQWSFDSLELACQGDHFDVRRAITEPEYVQTRWDILNRHDLKCYAISHHLVGQAVCDLIDSRKRMLLFQLPKRFKHTEVYRRERCEREQP